MSSKSSNTSSQNFSQIRYYALDRQKSEVRLLKIQPQQRSDQGSLLKCVSTHVSLDWYRELLPADESLPRWLTLSYTWGDETALLLIELDGVRVHVPRNLGQQWKNIAEAKLPSFPISRQMLSA